MYVLHRQTDKHKTEHLHNKDDSAAERSEGQLTLKFVGMQRISRSKQSQNRRTELEDFHSDFKPH